MGEYTPTKGEIVSALVAYRAIRGDRTPAEIVRDLLPEEVRELLGEVERGVLELERVAAEEAWNEGYTTGYNAPRYELDTDNYWEDNPYRKEDQ